MNKISLYLFLILAYLGLSKSFSPAEQSTPYIQDEHALTQFFTEAPICLILTESFQTGFLIHTYYHRYLAVYIFKEPQEIMVRTSEPFWRKNIPHLGLSLLRRSDTDPFVESTVPAPPGAFFLGNPAYGSWESIAGQQKVWSFHNAYKNLPEIFMWGDFQPSFEFYQTLTSHLEHGAVFFGHREEFGTKGEVSKKVLTSTRIRSQRFHFSLESTINRIFGEDSWASGLLPFSSATPEEKKAPKKIDTPPQPDITSLLGERPSEEKVKEEPETSIFLLDNVDDQDTFNE
jgi:hypothetical protein